jgi:hypothetical protein
MAVLCTASALLKAFTGLANGFSPLALPLVTLVAVIWFTWLRRMPLSSGGFLR